MKKFTSFLIVLLSILFITNISTAQENQTVIKKSDKKVIINGKQYYLHTVKKGETLYSISKSYNVEQNEIALENPDVFNGITEGQTLKIPIIKFPKENNEYFFHKVEKKQTLYSISKQYNIDINVIKKHNPEIENGLQVDQVLRIPKVNAEFAPKEVRENKNYIYHKVEKKETIYSISKKYDIKIKDLKNANPELEGKGLQVDQTLKIPRKNGIEIKPDTITTKSSLITKPSVPIDGRKIPLDSSIIPCDTFSYKPYKKPFKIGLMLPFFININDTVDALEVIKGKEKIFPNTNFIEFYEGALMAVEKINNEGVSVDLFVYDTKKDTNEVRKITAKSEFKNLDLIIGPVYASTLKIVSDSAKAHNIKIVSPLSSNTINLKNNPVIFQVIPDLETQLDAGVRHLANNYGGNYIIVHNGTLLEEKLIKTYKNKFISLLGKDISNSSTYNTIIKEVSYYKQGIKGIENSLIKDTTNTLIVFSTDRAFVSELMSKLNLLVKEYPISLKGMPAWSKYDNIETEYFHNLQLSIFSPSHIDYSKWKVQNFESKYLENFKTTPSKYCYQGYDVTYFFLSALKNHGKNFEDCLSKINVNLLQTEFEFKKTSKNGGYENKSVSVIKYKKDYTIEYENITPKN